MNPQSGVNLGSAYAEITIGNNIDSALDGATRSFDNALSSIGDSLSQVGAKMTSVGGAITLALAPLAGVFGKGIETASSYEDALKEIQARAGLTAEELEVVSEKALQLGADTAFSAQQAADAFLQLLTSGSSLEEAMVQIDAVMAGAAANGTELGYTADALTNVMAAFQLEAEQSAEVMQTLTAASSASSATFNDLVDGFANAGPVFKNFGMSVEEGAAALAVLRDTGISGAEAGTQLKSMLTNMARQTDDVTGMWNRLGISMYDAQGNMRDLDAIIKDLNVALEGMNDQERNEVITTLAGSYGQVGLSALLAADGISVMTGRMDEQGTMEEIAAARLDTFSGAVDALMGSLENLAIRVMTPFMEQVLKPTIQYITILINQLGEWAAANEPLVMVLLQVLSALFALGPALIGLGLILQVVGASVSALGVALGFLMSPITLVIAAVAGLAYIFRDQLSGAIQTGMGWMMAFGDFIRFFASDVQNSGLGDAILAIFGEGDVGRVAGSSLEGLLQKLGFSVDQAQEITDDVFGVFSHWFIQIKTVFSNIQGVLGKPFQKIKDFINMFFSGLNVGQSVWTALQASFGAVFGTTDWNQFGIDILNGIGAAFSVAGTWIYDTLLSPMIGAFNSVDWTQAGLDILDGLGRVLNTLMAGATWIYDNLLMPLWNSALTAIGSVDWTQVGITILSALGSALNTLGIWATWIYDNLLMPLWNNALTAISTIDWVAVGTTILSALGSAISTLGIWATWIYDNLLMPLFNNILSAIGTIDWVAVGTSILDALGSALSTLGTWGTWIYENLLMPIPNNIRAAIESVDWTSVGENLVYAIGDSLRMTFDFVTWLIDSIFSPMTSNAEGATDQIDWLVVGSAVLSAIGQSLINTFNFIQWIIDTILIPMLEGAGEAISSMDWSEIGTNLMDSIADAFPNIAQWVQDNITTPIQNALAGFNPLGGLNIDPSVVSPTGGIGFGSMGAGIVGGAIGDFFGSMFGGSRDSGGRGDAGRAYMIGTGAQPEWFVPDSPGTFIPNADELGGKKFIINIESITASTMAEAAALGDSFGAAFMNKLKNSGFAEDF